MAPALPQIVAAPAESAFGDLVRPTVWVGVAIGDAPRPAEPRTNPVPVATAMLAEAGDRFESVASDLVSAKGRGDRELTADKVHDLIFGDLGADLEASFADLAFATAAL